MANEISFRHTTAKTLYAILRKANGQHCVVSTGAFQNYATANWSTYTITMSETPSTGRMYVGNMPANVAAGAYIIELYERVGASPAVSDTLIAETEMAWSGTSELTQLDTIAAIDSVGVAVATVAGDAAQAAVSASAANTKADTIKAKTDLIPANIATQLTACVGEAAEANLAAQAASGKATAIKAKTDLIPASPAAVGSAMTLTTAYDAAKTPVDLTEVITAVAGVATTVGDVGGAVATLSGKADFIQTAINAIPVDPVDLSAVTSGIEDIQTAIAAIEPPENAPESTLILKVVDTVGQIGQLTLTASDE